MRDGINAGVDAVVKTGYLYLLGIEAPSPSI
jgi:hypothetical protein